MVPLSENVVRQLKSLDDSPHNWTGDVGVSASVFNRNRLWGTAYIRMEHDDPARSSFLLKRSESRIKLYETLCDLSKFSRVRHWPLGIAPCVL